jgi:uncharacterized protein
LPDINVWLALSWAGHPHTTSAWKWLRSLKNDEILFCRLTQLGLLRLLTTMSVMGDDCLSVGKSWEVYDRWLSDPKVEFRHESEEVSGFFRVAAAQFSHSSAPKALADCYLVAFSQASNADLVTLDTGLAKLAGKVDQDTLLLE